jgi:hypothetical protein
MQSIRAYEKVIKTVRHDPKEITKEKGIPKEFNKEEILCRFDFAGAGRK